MKLTDKQRLLTGVAGTAVILAAAGVGVWQSDTGALADSSATPAASASARVQAAPSQTPAKSGKIDLNTATQAELETLTGIGPVKAKAIIAGRPYKKISDVQRVSGVGAKTFAKIAAQLTVGE